MQNSIIQELIGLVKAELALLRKKQAASVDEYLRDWELQHIVERAFQNAIQACIDMGARVISVMSFRKAESYHDVIDVLWEGGVISGDLRERMHEMVGLRNALVHEYRVIRPREVYRNLQESLGTLEEFAGRMADLISGREV